MFYTKCYTVQCTWKETSASGLYTSAREIEPSSTTYKVYSYKHLPASLTRAEKIQCSTSDADGMAE